MLSISRLLGSNRNQVSINQRSKSQPKCEERLIPDKNDGLDTVSFSSKKSEKFADVRTELAKNVPDRTTTIEEKQKALSYIERMLKCSDITKEMKNYWANKRDTIQMEIQMIKNEQQAGKDSSSKKVVQEYRNFIQQRWCDNYPKERNSSLDFLDGEEYSLTFYNTCFSYLNRILACKDLTDSERSQFTQEINHWNAEKQSRLGEINWHKQNNKIKTESYKNVLTEMGNNVPNRTSTLEEKKLASAYIKRMTLCDDIPQDVKNYWLNKQNIIEMEIQGILNLQETNGHQKFEDVQKEFNEFSQKYWAENVLNGKAGLNNLAFDDAQEYYFTVRRIMITYCDRILACSDLPREEKQYYENIKNSFKCDLNSYAASSNQHNKTENKKTESFYDVIEEMRANVPDSTRTINEKRLAISYIERMLSCDDIPNPEYWQNKLNTIEKELQALENHGARRR